MSHEDEHWMRMAIAIGQTNRTAPFGAVIVEVDSNRECARGVNQAQVDPTRHAEMVALRNYFTGAGHPRSGALTLYSTAEPCPMCSAACFWAGIDRIVFGVSIAWLREHGWRQIALPAASILAAGDASTAIREGVLADECARLFLAAR
jgi:tRNA(adenine34) deaminase